MGRQANMISVALAKASYAYLQTLCRRGLRQLSPPEGQSLSTRINQGQGSGGGKPAGDRGYWE